MSNDTVIVKGIIKSVSNQYDMEGKRVYFQLDALGSNLIRNEIGLVRCLGPIIDVYKGAPVKITGTFEDDVLVCSLIELTWLSRDDTVKYLADRCRVFVSIENEKRLSQKKKKISGLGQKKMGAIVDAIGPDIFTLGNEDLRNKILLNPELSGIGDHLIQILLKARTEADNVLKTLYDELLPYKITTGDILKIRSTCTTQGVKDEADAIIQAIRENPYHIMLLSNVNIKIVDEYAYNIMEDGNKKRFCATDERRVRGYVLNELHAAAGNGHTYISTEQLVKNINYKSSHSKYGVGIPAAYISLVFAQTGSASVFLDKETKTVSLSKYREEENRVAKNLIRLLKAGKQKVIVTETEIDEVEAELDMKFGEDQRNAFRILESPGVAILTGGPGTGKTTVVNGLVALYKKHYPKAVVKSMVKFCAPTGKAAKQLTRSVRSSLSSGQSAQTIHKLINYNPFGSSRITDCEHSQKDKENPINADIIIVDESSMIEIGIMDMLLEAVKNETLVIFVGDEHQLSCIGAGNCLHDMIASGVFPVFRLVENFRQKGEGSIINNAIRINEGKMPIANQDDFIVVSMKNDEEGYQMLCKLMSAYYDKNDPFAVQLIEPSRKGSAGIYKMNKFVREEVMYKGRSDLTKEPEPGDKVLITKTETNAKQILYQRMHPEYDFDPYVNGDLGVIVTITDDEVVLFDGIDDVHYDRSSLMYMDFAYAYTIHKSQGSEAEMVIIYLPKSMEHMMTRSLLYTSVTRAKKKVIIVETGNALETCVNTVDDKRSTRLMELIQKLSK